MFLCENCGQAYSRRPKHCVRCHSENIIYKQNQNNKPAKSEKYALIGSILGIISFLIAVVFCFFMLTLISATDIKATFLIFCVSLLPFTFSSLILTAYTKPFKGLRITGLIFSLLSLIPWAVYTFVILFAWDKQQPDCIRLLFFTYIAKFI